MKCHNCGVSTEEQISTDFRFPKAVICLRCGGLMHPEINADQLSNEYGQDYFSGAEYLDYESSRNIAQLNFKRKLKILKNEINLELTDQRVLELGSATGEFLYLCQKIGVPAAMGVEISAYGRDACEKKGIKVLSPEDPHLLEKISEFRPTLLVAWDVWEHLYDPAEVFQKMIQACPDLRFISLTTVQFDSFTSKYRKEKWRLYHPPTHISYPTKKSFLLFFEGQGFEQKYNRHFGYYRSFMEYLVAAMPFLRKLLLKMSFFHKIPFYLNLYDIQFLIAVRSNHKVR